MRQLLAHRLCSRSSGAAKAEWYDIVEGTHPLWEVGGPEATGAELLRYCASSQAAVHAGRRCSGRRGSNSTLCCLCPLRLQMLGQRPRMALPCPALFALSCPLHRPLPKAHARR